MSGRSCDGGDKLWVLLNLIMWRRGWTCKMIYLIDFQHDGFNDIMDYQVEVRVPLPVLKILLTASEEVVNDRDMMTS